MVYIFHGDDQGQSRQAYGQLVDKLANSEILRLDAKEISPDIVNNFLYGQTLFATSKVLCLHNLFSANKASLDKVIKLINQQSEATVIIWQDKKLTLAQTGLFPKSEVKIFNLNSQLFSCINALKPGNLHQFVHLYHNMLQKEPFDLFFYLVKNSLRKQLSSYSKFNQILLKNTYLNLIELEYQNKSGQLTTDKEIALERILTNLIIQSR